MMHEHDIHPLLRGIVGSTAYGLATPESDVDRLGIHAVTTNCLFALRTKVSETVTTIKPDSASHEIHKACSLMFNGNPTILEMLWLDDYEVLTDVGERLIEIRRDFLSASRVRDAYWGYAKQQYHRFIERGSFADGLDKRREKHARHILRLLEQGLHLYRTGEVKIRVDDPDWTRGMAQTIAGQPFGSDGIVKYILSDYEDAFDATRTPLPDRPRFDRAEALIQTTRKTYWND